MAACRCPEKTTEIILEYKKSMMAGMGRILTPYAMQRKERVEAMVEPYCAASLDHKVIELVESLPDVQSVCQNIQI
jgi:DNA-binding TFAR19-related protein (PDSD5 family)